jgi:hypothetical protein
VAAPAFAVQLARLATGLLGVLLGFVLRKWTGLPLDPAQRLLQQALQLFVLAAKLVVLAPKVLVLALQLLDSLPLRRHRQTCLYAPSCQITRDLSRDPVNKYLTSHEVIVNLIASTTTRTGLRIAAALDPGRYQTGIRIRQSEMDALRIERDEFHPEWNYAILPRVGVGT